VSLWTTEVTDGVCVATYAFPPMNYIGAEGTNELTALIERWKDPEIRAIVVAGAIDGKFITHYYGEELLGLDRTHLENSDVLGLSPIPEYNEMLRAMQRLPKPIIAAMNGDAMGGGFEFCLACDIRVGESGDFRYGLPETLLGLIPGGGGTQRLPRLIGVSKAMNFILRGQIVTPKDAYDLGIVCEVVEDSLFRAKEIARQLAKLPTTGLARAKRAVYEGFEMHIDSGLNLENAGFMDTILAEETAALAQEYFSLDHDQRRGWFEKRTKSGD